MTDEKRGDEIVSVEIGPPVSERRHMAHYELANGQTGYGYVKQPTEGEVLQPNERMIFVNQAREDGRRLVRELYRHGPAQYASKAYRDGWDTVFAKKRSN